MPSATAAPVVLVVEDDDDIRDTLVALLRARGVPVVAAKHGREAIDRVHELGARPALVILDLLMPVMSGEEFLGVQDSEPLLARVPVVILTAQLRLPEEVPPNVCAILQKPVRLSEILDAVRSATGAAPPIPPPASAVGTDRIDELVLDVSSAAPVAPAAPDDRGGDLVTASDPRPDLPGLDVDRSEDRDHE